MAAKKTGSNAKTTASLGFGADFGLGRADTFRRDLHAELADYMAAFLGQLFYSTQIPVCLWFLGKNKSVKTESYLCLFDGETKLSLIA